QRLPRVARDLAVPAVHVEDRKRIGVEGADGVGGVVDDGAEARVGVDRLGVLHDVVEESPHEADADDGDGEEREPGPPEQHQAPGVEQGEARERREEDAHAERERVAGADAPVAARPDVGEAAGRRGRPDREHARPAVAAAEPDAVGGGQRRGEERRRPSLEERDERHGNGLRVDVDPLGGLDESGDEHHGEPAEGRADEQRASAYVPRGPRLEPPIGVRVEERAEDQDPRDLDEVMRADGYSTSTTISISTGMPIGSSAMPTAERACRPIASPKTSTMRSENPLITRGWSPKPSAEFTMPSTLTTRLTRSRLSTLARIVASRE